MTVTISIPTPELILAFFLACQITFTFKCIPLSDTFTQSENNSSRRN